MRSQSPPHDLACDIGDIRNVEVLIDGVWWRPDAFHTSVPVTLSTGPFPVRARLEDHGRGVFRVTLNSSNPLYGFGTFPMTIAGSDLHGTIPAVASLGDQVYYGVQYYLEGFNAEGYSVEFDEIAYACDPYEGGDPFNFLIVNPVAAVGQLVNQLDSLVVTGQVYGVGPGHAGEARLDAIRLTLLHARDLVELGDVPAACNLLSMAARRIDGLPAPPDFIDGDGVSVLSNLVASVRSLIGCD